jgi:hypothetical protein
MSTSYIDTRRIKKAKREESSIRGKVDTDHLVRAAKWLKTNEGAVHFIIDGEAKRHVRLTPALS